ncbi:hypothetical protein PV10_06524 [Exophiala mesophila]|uniref:Large ribosomal subunit protein mL54 n=1 Tax=Exophiala mesophila TaxID=212818 RepID=A0A0D1WSC3_EXOME|nr:uncharacterized protein PV10_06524 [Exophiala mesophila]KIV92050.1 hypothetical protein PV10_06524 [Exophiala mesophila]
MICSSCRRSLLQASIRTSQTAATVAKSSATSCSSTPFTSRRVPFPLFQPLSHLRSVSTVPSTPNAAPSTPPPSTSTSTSTANPTQSSSHPAASQPLSTPQTKPPTTIKPRKLQSSVPGGAELKGLGYTKAQPVIKAMEDDEYPDWLWGLLEQGNKAPGETKVDLSAMTKKQRARWDKAQEKIRAKMPVKIPLHEQSMDLTQPGDDAITSLKRRQEITKSKRVANRKDIRESNFLKTM